MDRIFTPVLLLLLASISACSSTRIVVQPDPQYAPVDLNALEHRPVENGSIFQRGRSIRLFEDNKAYRVGDILAVTLSESTNASKSAATNTSKDNDVNINGSVIFGSQGPTIDGNLALSNTIDAERSFARLTGVLETHAVSDARIRGFETEARAALAAARQNDAKR